MKLPLHEHTALTFDCFGTLIDWETGILNVLRPWAKGAGLDATDDALLGAYARAESAEERERPGDLYRDVLRGVMRRVGNDLGGAVSDDDAEALSASVGDWPVFEDTPAALAALQERAKLIVVSNVDRASFEKAAPKLGVTLDGLVTAEDVGAYKPDVRMFRAALEAVARTGAKPREHLHVAQSLHHDIAPAGGLGIATCWIDRRAGRPGGATPESHATIRPGWMFTTMRELAESVSASASAALALQNGPEHDE